FFWEYAEDGNRKMQLTIVAVSAFFLFFAFRGFVFSDWTNYYSYFENVEWYDVLSWELGSEDFYEPGFALLNLICKSAFNNFHFFVFVHTSIVLAIILLFFKQNNMQNIPLALAIFISFGGLGMTINLMRNLICIGIFLVSIPYTRDRRPVYYFAMCTAALMFHFSAIIYFPLYFVLHITINRWIYLGVFLALNVFFLSKASIFLTIAHMLGLEEAFVSRMKAYTELMSASRGLSIGYLERLGTGCLVFLYYEKLKEVRKGQEIFLNSLLLYYVAIFMFAEFSVLSNRLGNLFIFSYWIIWYDIFKVFSISNNRKLFACAVSIYCILKIHLSIINPTQKYDNILFGAETYEQRLSTFNKTMIEE
ncbi:MAG: EpsG family protein, partial [Bacteroidaceae bacterium]|nr:EpsG family protein [Bacteroidaceae bacterium]